MINSLSPFCSTHTDQTAAECRNRLSLAACQPITTPHHQPCHLSPPPTCVPPRLNLFPSTSFFHYVAHLEESAFITFDYLLYQSSPSYRAGALCCLTPPPTPSILQQKFTFLQLVRNYRPTSFLLFNPIVSQYFSSHSSPPVQPQSPLSALPGPLDVFHSALIKGSLI